MRQISRRFAWLAALAVALVLAIITTGSVDAASALRSTTIQIGMTGGLTSTTPGLGTGTGTSFTLSENWTTAFTDGSSGANKANKVYVLHAATTTTVDLDSTLTLADGSTGAFARILAIAIKPDTANSAALTLGGDWLLTKYLIPAGDTLANVTIPINKTGVWMFTAPDATGIAVTATTGDGLTLTVAGSDGFSLVVIGT